MRGHLSPANLLTSGCLTAGFLGVLTAPTSTVLTALLVVLAAVLDSLDGLVARKNGGDTAFGTNLDSLADLVSFGVVPALAVYYAVLADLQVIGLAGCVGFVLCGAWRLARFPLVKSYVCFAGLPIPPAGVLVMVVALWHPSPVLTLLLLGGMSLLMVSTVPFPTLAHLIAAPSSVAHRVRDHATRAR